MFVFILEVGAIGLQAGLTFYAVRLALDPASPRIAQRLLTMVLSEALGIGGFFLIRDPQLILPAFSGATGLILAVLGLMAVIFTIIGVAELHQLLNLPADRPLRPNGTTRS